MRCGIITLAIVLLLAVGPAVAADRGSHIRITGPKAGEQVPIGTAPTFSGRVRARGQVWVHVCDSKRLDRNGVICDDEAIGRARRRGTRFSYKPRFFDFPEFWLNTEGTYYWQAHRVACERPRRRSDCQVGGPVVRFTVG